MNQKTLRALKASIKHWEENVAAETPEQASISPTKCALCKLFYWKAYLECKGCPVAEKTGKPCCNGSPYEHAEGAYQAWRIGIGNREAFRKAARAERRFLKSLLPKDAA